MSLLFALTWPMRRGGSGRQERAMSLKRQYRPHGRLIRLPAVTQSHRLLAGGLFTVAYRGSVNPTPSGGGSACLCFLLSPVGALLARGLDLGPGTETQRRRQQVAACSPAEYCAKVPEGRALVAVILRNLMWRGSDQHHQAVHRAAELTHTLTHRPDPIASIHRIETAIHPRGKPRGG